MPLEASLNEREDNNADESDSLLQGSNREEEDDFKNKFIKGFESFGQKTDKFFSDLF